MLHKKRVFSTVLLSLAALPGLARGDGVIVEPAEPEGILGAAPYSGGADSTSPGNVAAARSHRPFVEASGAFGVQFGTSPYLPEGDGTAFHHPLTNGPAFGVSAGLTLLPGLHAIANVEHTSASSRDGQVENVIDRVDGLLAYTTAVLGLRSIRRIGPGYLFGELAAGVVLPFHSEVVYDYAENSQKVRGDALATRKPINGRGSRRDEYNLGLGAHGLLGYQIGLGNNLYVGAAVKLKGFSTTNDGKQTIYDNFVQDFADPSAISTTVDYDKDGNGSPPSTYSVQDLRLQVLIGARL